MLRDINKFVLRPFFKEFEAFWNAVTNSKTSGKQFNTFTPKERNVKINPKFLDALVKRREQKVKELLAEGIMSPKEIERLYPLAINKEKKLIVVNFNIAWKKTLRDWLSESEKVKKKKIKHDKSN